MSFYKYCPVCGYITTVPIAKCTFCENSEIIETNVEVPDLFHQFKLKDEINNQIEERYKIKDNPLYSEEAVQRRLQKEQKQHDDFYNGKSHNYTTAAPNVPKCPICQSTNLSKITTLKKATKIAVFSIFGLDDTGKTWKCNNCGSKF